MNKRILRASAALAIVFGLTACSEEPVPTLEPVEGPTAPLPALGSESLEAVLAETEATLVEADAASDGEALAARFTGPAHGMRLAQYDLASVSAGAVPVVPLEVTAQLAIVNASFDWPRMIVAVSEIPQGANLPILYTMVQESPRADFKVWSWVRLFPGVTLPQTAVSELGSRYVGPEDTSLVLSPTEVLAAYADVVNTGAESEHAAMFQDDHWRSAWITSITAISDTVAEAGTATQVSAVSPSGTMSIGTADGGAIVTGVLDQEVTITRTEADSTLTVGDNLAYYGEHDVVGTLTTRLSTTLAFYVPPAGSGEQIQVLGAEQVVLGADRDDSTNPD